MSLVRGTSLSGLPELVQSLGCDADALLASVGISAADAGRHDVFVPLPRVAMAIETAALLTGTPDFGRRLAERQGIDILGPVGVAARTAATVVGALRVFERYLAAYSPGLAVRLGESDDPECVFFEFVFTDRDLPPITQSVELSLGVTLRVLRFLIGARHNPVAVHLPHEPLTSVGSYRRFYGCDARFAERTAGFTLRRVDLEKPLAQDQLGHEAIVAYLSGITTRNDATGDTVQVLVRQLLPSGTAKLKSVAGQLGLHPKTLQRRLADEHTTFAAITDGVRRELADRLLRDTGVTLAHLAHELGYAEQSVLTRSCQRWFGCPPGVYRKAAATSPELHSSR
ncbi:AraC family transcriptional regulator [Mycolicibacterium pyrenivorans]|uniref:AraC family transcriptional regulator n=1 Tax=Mycolicibacterium pyrenivorans TaxID=187102 RepID=UPI0021F367AB|nr:AraC family transcriptional regulator [Mycolicibacterium pyrenivorans]MCV7149943.1 AraC family transcriptional regulator [Mycolicibacterium pyrenivorans]